MRKVFFLFVVCVLIGTASYGEDAAIAPESKMRLTLNQSLGYADGGLLAATGLGIEYGVSHWLNLQLLWNPGIKYQPDLGYSSIFFGAKTFLFGDGALVQAGAGKVRFSAALGMFLPLPDEPDLLDQDQMLWGSTLRLYSDFIFSPNFYINLYVEGVFYPAQYTDNSIFYGSWTRHYLDLTSELEMHIVIPLENDAILKFGAPVRFFYAPFMNDSDEYATNQYVLSTGAYFGVITPTRYPVEAYLRYTVHLLGHNIKQVHRGSVIIKVTTGNLKRRAKSSEPVETMESSESDTSSE